jgi:hypothetical protein
MQNQITKTTDPNLLLTKWQSSLPTLQALARPETWSQVLANVPRSIEQVIERPPITALLRAGATISSLEACLAIEITRTANMLTVGGNLREGQSLEIAKELIAEYPNESLEDFCLCLRNGLKGKYSEPGKTFRFDIMVIFEWFKLYLEEKYQVIEDKLMREKDTQYTKAPLLPEQTGSDERSKEWLKKWREEIEKGQVKKIAPLTTQEILEEGQREPKQSIHRNGYTLEFVQMRQKLARVASDYYKGRKSYSGLSLHQVNGFDIFAESEEHAMEIYELATTQE